MFKPTKYDPTTAPYDDEGLFYDGEEILSVIQYECDEDWSEYEACISYLGHDLVAFTDLSNPEEYDVIADYEILEQLAAE